MNKSIIEPNDPMTKAPQDFEKRVRKLLENDDMRFRWDLYYPWFFLADLAILAGIVFALVWWFR